MKIIKPIGASLAVTAILALTACANGPAPDVDALLASLKAGDQEAAHSKLAPHSRIDVDRLADQLARTATACRIQPAVSVADDVATVRALCADGHVDLRFELDADGKIVSVGSTETAN